MVMYALTKPTKIVLSAGMLCAGAILWSGANGAIARTLNDLQTWLNTQPILMINEVTIHGADDATEALIRAHLSLDLPASTLALDLNEMRTSLLSSGPVENASLVITPGGELSVTITQRTGAFVWRSEDALSLLDIDGRVITAIPARSKHPELPLIAGLGAERATREAAAIFAAAHPIGERIRGLVRVGERRWNIELDNNVTILLPQDDPVSASHDVLALITDHAALDRNITVIDFRTPTRRTIRLGSPSPITNDPADE